MKLQILNIHVFDFNNTISVEKAFKDNNTSQVTHACICSYNDQGDIADYILDITDNLRKFRCYYGSNSEIRWKHVLSYLVKESSLSIPPNYGDFYVYINLEGHEVQLRIGDILHRRFVVSIASESVGPDVV